MYLHPSGYLSHVYKLNLIFAHLENVSLSFRNCKIASRGFPSFIKLRNFHLIRQIHFFYTVSIWHWTPTKNWKNDYNLNEYSKSLRKSLLLFLLLLLLLFQFKFSLCINSLIKSPPSIQKQFNSIINYLFINEFCG